MSNLHTVPPHLAEAVFRRWEPVLVAATTALNNGKMEYEVTPGDLAVTTVTAALRNSIRSARVYNWTTTLTQPELAILEVSSRGSAAVIRHSGLFQAERPACLDVVQINAPTEEQTRAVMCLCEARVLCSGAELSGVEPAQIKRLAESYDVHVETLNDTTVRIV